MHCLADVRPVLHIILRAGLTVYHTESQALPSLILANPEACILPKKPEKSRSRSVDNEKALGFQSSTLGTLGPQ